MMLLNETVSDLFRRNFIELCKTVQNVYILLTLKGQKNTNTHIYMEFRKMLMITVYAEQKKRHRCIEQSFRLCGRRRGWDVSREQHRNMYII